MNVQWAREGLVLALVVFERINEFEEITPVVPKIEHLTNINN